MNISNLYIKGRYFIFFIREVFVELFVVAYTDLTDVCGTVNDFYRYVRDLKVPEEYLDLTIGSPPPQISKIKSLFRK